MTRRWAWLFDIGSTFTKLTVLDVDDPARRFRSQAPTTVASDVREGIAAAVHALEAQGGPQFADAHHRAASSSAAGGLALVVSGLVPRLSAEAGRVAALGAGAKLVGTWSHRLTGDDLARLAAARPDIVLLTGGTDGGDRRTLLENAAALASLPGCPMVVVAGNRDVSAQARDILLEAGVRAVAVGNILPELDRLNVEPARAAIRDEFLTTIVHAKGIDRAADRLDAPILPTPQVVLGGVQLLAERLFDGALMAIEVGGATTNVHSWAPSETDAGVVFHGLPEPQLKRTVEGDLGVRWNAHTILELAGRPWVDEQLPGRHDELAAWVERVAAEPSTLPASEAEQELDALLATFAARTGIVRHCGRQRQVTLATGPVVVQEGKDLRRVHHLVGTGGSVVCSGRAAEILAAAVVSSDPFSLMPTAPAIHVDAEYLLYAVGLLAPESPDVAVELAQLALRAPLPAGVR